MNYSVLPLTKLTECFARLPGIGRKSAQRLAFHILRMPEEEAKAFANAILEAREKIGYCEICKNITDTPRCAICSDETRDKSTVCVVEDPRDVIAMLLPSSVQRNITGFTMFSAGLFPQWTAWVRKTCL